MGYQALLFCPDEKLARVVSQVFSELDFSVEPVHEPFAAVKKLMAQRYDAIVVDCENEQNASLLFKSARNSSFNQSSLAIALVEGQAGVAKAYRIGANLVLTKPINVEQAKGTLRVARGLLRKNLDAAGGAATAAIPPRTAPASSASAAASASANSSTNPSLAPSRSAPMTAPAATPLTNPYDIVALETPPPAPIPVDLPAIAAATPAQVQEPFATAVEPVLESQQLGSQHVELQHHELQQLGAASAIPNNSIKSDAAKNEAITTEAARAILGGPVHNSTVAFTSAPGSAAATAPAKEAPAAPVGGYAVSAAKVIEFEAAHPSPETAPAPIPFPSPSSTSSSSQSHGSLGVSDAPSFGGLGDENSGGAGGNKKMLIAAGVVLAVAALGYVGYGMLGKSSTPTAQPVSASQASAQPTAAQALKSSSSSLSSPIAIDAPAEKPITLSSAANSSGVRIAANASPNSAENFTLSSALPTKKPETAPIFVKSSSSGVKAQSQVEESAPQLPGALGAESENDSKLSSLMSSTAANPSRPALETLRISQGVSQGLLIKRVQPVYPQAALAVRAQGVVQIEATINKDGHVSNLKVLSGDPVLARAALEAVRQWRYKPYYLDGAPVEIQTQIAVTFKSSN